MKKDQKEPEMPDFGMPMDFAMPDFSQIGKTMKMLSWLPAILSAVSIFCISFLAQVVYNGLTQADYKITYGAFMWMVLLSLAVALLVGAAVKMAAERKMKKSPMMFGM